MRRKSHAQRGVGENSEITSNSYLSLLQKAMLGIKARFGKNAVLKGINMIEGATMRERNQQVGGHKA